MADMNGLRMTLVSDPTPEFPNNTNTAFQVRLADPLQLKGDGWETALVSISTPNKGITAAAFGMEDDDYLLDMTYTVTTESSPVTSKEATAQLKAGTIFNIPGGIRDGIHLAQLISYWIVNTMTTLGQSEYASKKTETRMYWDLNVNPTVIRESDGEGTWRFEFFQHDRTDSKCEVKINRAFGEKMGWWKADGALGRNVLPRRSDDRYNNRGYLKSVANNVASIKVNDTSVTHDNKVVGIAGTRRSVNMMQLSRNYTWYFTNLNASFHYASAVDKRAILVYTDLVQTSYMGHQKHELLREVFLKHGEHDTQQLIEPLHYQWLPVRSQMVEVISVELADLNGSLIQLPKGKTLVTVALRQARAV